MPPPEDAPLFPPETARKMRIAAVSGILWGASLLFLGIPYCKTATIAVLAMVASLAAYGTKWIQRLGIVLAAFAIAVWIEVLPPLDRWRALIFSLFPPG